MNAELILARVGSVVQGAATRGPVKAYVFGSAAIDAETWSDVDILLVCHDQEDGDIVRGALQDLCTEYPIDLLVMTEDEASELGFVERERCRRIV